MTLRDQDAWMLPPAATGWSAAESLYYGNRNPPNFGGGASQPRLENDYTGGFGTATPLFNFDL